MTFAAPLFLLAALAGIIPVALHMVHRQRAKVLPFPTLQFLRISAEKTRRRRRVHDAVLMALRAALLMLVAVGLSKPTVTSLVSVSGGGNAAVAIVLDNSASMGMIDQDRVRFDTALGAVDQILRELADGDQVGLFLTGGPPFPEQDKLNRSQDSIRQILGQVQVSHQRADLAAKLRQARKALADCAAGNKQIYVVTDQQSVSWEGLNKAGEMSEQSAGDTDTKTARIPVIVVDCNRAPKPDAAVQSVALETAMTVAGLPVKATVELLNASSHVEQRHIELYLDGNKEATSPDLKLSAGGKGVHDFSFVIPRGGLHRGEVRLAGEDGSKFDDRRYFAMEVNQGIPVALVKAKRHEVPYLDDTFYLQQALAPARAGESALQTTVLTAADLADARLENYKVIFCVNLPAATDEVAGRLRTFVQGGGSLVWICGDAVDADAYNRMNQAAGGGLLPVALAGRREIGPQDNRDSWHIAFLDKQHPALSMLVEPPSLYESVLVSKHVRMDVSAGSDARVLARLDDGQPLLVERRIQKGGVVMLGTSAHVGWSNLPLRNIFLPLMARLTYYLAGTEQKCQSIVAGSPLVLHLDTEPRSVEVEVIPPSGETFRLGSKQEDGGSGQVFRYLNTYQPGIYLLRLIGAQRPAQYAFAVNVDPDEAVAVKIDREDLERRLAGAPILFAANPNDLSSTFKGLREGRSLWEPFLLAVLLALVFETFLSNRLAPRWNDSAAMPARAPT